MGEHNLWDTLTPMATAHDFGEQPPSQIVSARRAQQTGTGFVEAPVPGLNAAASEAFAQLGEEYFELCERLFPQGTDFSLT